MKEAFEKIKERLEAKGKETSRRWIPNEGNDKEFSFFVGMVEGILLAQKIVSEVEKEYGNGWIPVEKAIPEDGQPIIATFTDGSVYQVNFKLFLHENPEYAHNHNVIAWMPLPSPYEPKGVRYD